MNIRKTTMEDLDQILSIYAYARKQMRLSGNPDQWGEDKPSPELIKNDIQNGSSYVIIDPISNDIAGVFTFIIGDDPTYQRIENGSWLNHDTYGTIHRIASCGTQKGIFRCCLAFCETLAPNIRIDTHECNRTMQHLLESNGYIKCGRIYVTDGSPRIAYQKQIQPATSNHRP